MKKSIFPVLLVIFAMFSGCKSKSDSGSTTDSTSTGSTGNPKTDINATAQIVPPQVASQPILVSTRQNMNPDSIKFSGIFFGPNMQMVTITMPPGAGNTPPPFIGNNGMAWGPFTALAPAAGAGNITVTASVNPPKPPYTGVVNNPLDNTDLTGHLTSTYNDGPGGDSSQINVQEQIPIPPTGH